MRGDDLKLAYLREIALEILEATREPILLSAYGDNVLHSQLAFDQIIKALETTVAPLFSFPKKDDIQLDYAIQAIRKARMLRRQAAMEPMKIHKDCIIEQA